MESIFTRPTVQGRRTNMNFTKTVAAAATARRRGDRTTGQLLRSDADRGQQSPRMRRDREWRPEGAEHRRKQPSGSSERLHSVRFLAVSVSTLLSLIALSNVSCCTGSVFVLNEVLCLTCAVPLCFRRDREKAEPNESAVL